MNEQVINKVGLFLSLKIPLIPCLPLKPQFMDKNKFMINSCLWLAVTTYKVNEWEKTHRLWPVAGLEEQNTDSNKSNSNNKPGQWATWGWYYSLQDTTITLTSQLGKPWSLSPYITAIRNSFSSKATSKIYHTILKIIRGDLTPLRLFATT